ncbi:MAG: aminoglycoside 3'-phosphotransferase [Clostridia bacterium]|nr:aminoglycoside 3'-phosphotransferase [Clostridia bacterium]
MKRTLITPTLSEYPASFHPLMEGAPVYDSSCSPEARVIFIDREGGYYLKSAPKGTLEREAQLDRYFHGKGLGAEVLEYLSGEKDWLLTARVEGEDCTHATYLEDPKRLCDLLAERLRALHELDPSDCPVRDRMETYLATAERNYREGNYDSSLFPDNWGYASAQEAWDVVAKNGHLFQNDTLLHGDYCLPNIMLKDWAFSGFIDLGNGGVGDRHVDLFWGAWTLNFNLKTDAYRERFFDAYGRDRVEEDMLRLVAAAEVFG